MTGTIGLAKCDAGVTVIAKADFEIADGDLYGDVDRRGSNGTTRAFQVEVARVRAATVGESGAASSARCSG